MVLVPLVPKRARSSDLQGCTAWDLGEADAEERELRREKGWRARESPSAAAWGLGLYAESVAKKPFKYR